MKNRIVQLFESKKEGILSIFYTAGFPTVDDTVPIAVALAKAGVDMIEIGIPFSDPIADGPIIQQSNKQAIEGGMRVAVLLEQVAHVRKQTSIPIVLMGYLNPVLQYGMERFCQQASRAGVDGVILPDMPMAEYLQRYRELFRANGLLNAFLISPTTSELRIRAIDSVTEGFIYAVSASSTTGTRHQFEAEQIAYFERLRALGLSNPYLIGFGISNAQTLATACRYAAGAIVGSSFIQHLAAQGVDSAAIQQFVHDLRQPAP
jgi:tryptophan synthase alpha chain